MLKIPIIIISIIITLNSRCDCGNIDNALRKYAIFPNLPPGISSNNTICDIHSRIYRENLDNFTLWAHEMWDGTAKSISGTLNGNMYEMGNFEECLRVEAPFTTQYCLVTFVANVPAVNRTDPLSLHHDPNEHITERLYFYNHRSLFPRNLARIGWCIPASCEPEDLQRFLEDYVQHLDIPLAKQNQINYSVSVTDLDCQTLDDRNFDTADIAFCVFTGVLLLIVSLATIIEVNQSKTIGENPVKPSRSKRILLAFSLQSNFRSFMKIPPQNSPLDILHGVRIFCMLVVIFGHRAGSYSNVAISNADKVENLYRQVFAAVLLHSDLFVDTFFMMSGILVSYNLFKQLDKKFINPAMVIFLRYIRLTPILAYIVFFHATLLNHIGTGPMWKNVMMPERNDCRENWWVSVLYLNNFINVEHVCMLHTWYLACEFQFFLLTVGICYLIYRSRKFGLFVLFATILMPIITQFLLTYIYEKPAVFRIDRDFMVQAKSSDDMNFTYNKPYARAATYLIGVLTGYVYYRTQNRNLQISKMKSYIILTLSTIVMLATLFGAIVFHDPYHAYNRLEAATFAALTRPAWILGSIGFFYAASYGHVRFIYRILSWKPWIILGKLAYAGYLAHVAYDLRSLGTLSSSVVFNQFNLAILVMTDTVLTVIISIILFLIIELPVRNISQELLFGLGDSVQKQEVFNKSNHHEE